MVRRVRVVSYGLLCFLAGAAFMLLAGASGTEEAPVGRYQVSAMSSGAFILDTQTGYLWERLDVSATCYDLGTLDHPICELVKP
jgi:hypothetical protein